MVGLAIPLRFEMRERRSTGIAGGVPTRASSPSSPRSRSCRWRVILDAAHPPALVVVLDGVEDPRNLGAILRTAEAAGADGVVLPERHSAGLSETVARASAGALEHVAVARSATWCRRSRRSRRGALGRGLRRGRHREVGRGRPRPARRPRPRRRGTRHPAPRARALRPPRLDPALRPRRLAERLGGGRHRPLRGGAPAAGGAGRVRPIPARPAPAPRIIGPAPDDEETDPGARPLPPVDVDAHDRERDLEHGDDEPPLPGHPRRPHDDVAWGRARRC